MLSYSLSPAPFSLLDDSYDSDLCSGRPVGAVTTLRNGTMVVFRGQRRSQNSRTPEL